MFRRRSDTIKMFQGFEWGGADRLNNGFLQKFNSAFCKKAGGGGGAGKAIHTLVTLQGSAKMLGLGCVNSLPGSGWL